MPSFEPASTMSPRTVFWGTPRILQLAFPLRASTSCDVLNGSGNGKAAWEKRVKVGTRGQHGRRSAHLDKRCSAKREKARDQIHRLLLVSSTYQLTFSFKGPNRVI